ncbi:ribonuclease H-like domain-containing protein [Tanacetum coccineum]
MSGEEPATQIAPVESPQMVSTVKLPILKKGEYTLWSMRMEQYLTNTDYSLWQVILNGDGPIQVTTDENGVETEVPPKTAQALLARQRERKAKSILLLAIPDEYQLRFHAIKDAKTLWAAIKSRFGGNVESKKMQKNVLKQQFENFSVSDTEGLDKAYDRFGRVPVSAAKQTSLRATASTSTFRQVNTATHSNVVNVSKLRTNAFHKSHSPIKMPFYKSTAPNTRISNEKVITVRVNGVNTVGQIAVSTIKETSARGGKRTRKGKIRTNKLDFKDVFFVKELKFNLFFVSQMCDKKNNVLFTETECLVLSPDFKLLDESQVLLKVPRQSNMYNFDLKNVVPSRDLTCLFAKAIIDESNLWHRRLGHVNIKTMNKLVKKPCQRTLIEAARTMLADSLLPSVFWAEVVNTACYVLNRVLVTKSHNKISYELILGRPPSISFMRPFRCPVTILNTLDPLGKFDGKAEEGFLVGYSVNSKAFRVFNSETRKVEENLHVNFLENKPNGPQETNATKLNDMGKEDIADDAAATEQSDAVRKEFEAQCNMQLLQGKAIITSSTNSLNTVSTPVRNWTGPEVQTIRRWFCEVLDVEGNPTKIAQALNDESWVEAMQEERLQFKSQKVWTLVDLPYGKKAIGTKWVYENKKDERGIVVRNKARLTSLKEDGIFISQDKYVGEILKKFSFSSIRTASTPIETNKALTKDEDGEDVDIHLYRCLFGQEIHNRRLSISWFKVNLFWQCKKQIVVANSTTEAEYIAASHYCGQVLWIQNQMLDYGYIFMQTKIHVDNESAICFVKNPHCLRGGQLGMTERKCNIKQKWMKDETIYKEWEDRIEKAATTASSLEAEQDSGGHTSGHGEGRMEHQFELMANVPITPHDSPLSGGSTRGSDEGRLKLQELMTMCTKLSKQVESLDDDLDEDDASEQERSSDKTKAQC